MTNPHESEKKKALELAIAHIQKQFGEGAIMSLGQHSSNKGIDIIKTGSIALDFALGIGGVPRGRIVEIYGPESSGKSTLALHIVANSQRQGGIAAYIDAEHALDPSYAAKIGVNLNDLMISQPDSGEEALNIAETLARSNAVDVIVIDSVAALVPKNELDGEIGDTHMGLQARMMSQALRKLTSSLSKSNTCAIFINQIREKIGVMFGNPETTTGGRALKFYASLRLDIRRIASIKGADNQEQGSRTRVKVVKNKMAPPFRVAEFDIMFNEGISKEGSLIDLGVDLGVIEKKGTWLSFENTKLGQGREAAKDLLKKDGSLFQKIEMLLAEKNKKNESVAEKAPT
ncbi:MAG: recombinase RecA [Parachlamydiales bacterium]|nr:recombinase RecA [Parachlamydiales bacterium]